MDEGSDDRCICIQKNFSDVIAYDPAIEELTKNKTIIMIAHRLSTIRNADQILVFNNGKIEQRGNHEELMKQGGLYRNLIYMKNKATVWKIAN